MTSAALSAQGPTARKAIHSAVIWWLIVCCAMIFVMVVLGGVTRLTESGLSMVEWRPLTGFLPPLSDARWEEIFAQYKHSPEFQKLNFWMTLADFKQIFWMEFIHRLWGRAIGVVFFLPLIYFAARRWLPGRLLAYLSVAFVLGAAQGVLGWYMVKSGLVDRPDVSQYRLAAHLSLALLVYGYLLWLVLHLTADRAATAVSAAPRWFFPVSLVLLTWIAVTVFWGALVAGLDAGLAYNTFPLMDGSLIPPDLLAHQPWPINFFDSVPAVQFAHRVLAISLVVTTLAVWALSLRRLAGRARTACTSLAAMAVIQASLGIATLLTFVAIPIAATHQAGAVVLLSLGVWCVFEARRACGTAR